MAPASGFHLSQVAPGATTSSHQRSHRPGPSIRSAIGGLGIALAAITAVLLLSDRAPSVLRRTFGSTAADLSARFNVEARAMLFLDDGLPETDTLFHIGLWAGVTLLVALTIWTWRGAAASALAAFAGSVALELAQGRFSSTRVVELRDIHANGLGVIVGLALALTCMAVWATVSRLTRSP